MKEISKAIGVAILVLLLIAFLLPIIGYYSNKWSDYWERKDYQAFQVTNNDPNLFENAYNECGKKAEKMFGVDIPVSYYASSTPEGYDCWALDYKKIP